MEMLTFPAGLSTCLQMPKLPNGLLMIIIFLCLIGQPTLPEKEDEKHATQKYKQAKGCYESNLGFINTSPVPQAAPPQATPHRCSNCGEGASINKLYNNIF